MATDPGTPRPPRLVVSGATGRLGAAVLEVAAERGWPLVGAIAGPRSVEGAPNIRGRDASGAPARVRPPRELPALLEGADVYVGTAPAEVEREHLPRVAARSVPAVVASTGFSASDDGWLAEIATRIPLVLESNFSVGVAWITDLLRRPGALPAGFDAGVVEAHRRGKRDRPSGTASQLATLLENARAPSENAPLDVASLRIGETPGIHEIWLGGRYEVLRIEHVVFDRRAFAEGIARSVEWLRSRGSSLPAGRYRFADMMAPEVRR